MQDYDSNDIYPYDEVSYVYRSSYRNYSPPLYIRILRWIAKALVILLQCLAVAVGFVLIAVIWLFFLVAAVALLFAAPLSFLWGFDTGNHTFYWIALGLLMLAILFFYAWFVLSMMIFEAD